MSGTDTERRDAEGRPDAASGTDADLGATFDLALVALVAPVVVLDGLYGVSYAALLFGLGDPPAVLAAVPTVRGLLHLAAVAALAVAALAAGVRSLRAAAVVVAVGAPAVAVYVVTGVVLPWDQRSFFVAQSLLEWLVAVPVVGRPIAGAVFGATVLGRATLVRAFLYHYGVLAVGAVAVFRAAWHPEWGRRVLGGPVGDRS